MPRLSLRTFENDSTHTNPTTILKADIHHILQQYWGYNSFRPLQEEIIHSILDKKDTLALMPTGGGKSLCYQVPAMAMDGMCLVISPLIALMKDQVENLRKRNITAYALYSGMTRKEVLNVMKVVTESNCKFLYVSPERIETSLFREYLPGMGISLLAVDEAHCISQWGYDFRPPYLRIASLREELPGVPVLALTASATGDVQKDICDKLQLSSSNTWNIFRQSFERPNISYSVFREDSKINKIIDILQKVPGTGIVYCRSRRRTNEICELLRLKNISADYYHAGLSQEERTRKQEDWIQDKTRVIVCTNAFGMGIDKPSVRVVIHADIPDCLENYYQEAGRAGRDGEMSYAVLLYNLPELDELKEMPSKRFPLLEEIMNVYQAVMNFLQLPAGTQEGESFDFDLPDFLRKFKMNGFTTLYSLKALEQDGWLAFNEQVFLPSMIEFNLSKERLYVFENENPHLEPLIKTLLRTYEGIFDRPVSVSEKMIANLLKKDPAIIKEQLKELDNRKIIDYRPQKDTPQLTLLRPRVRAEELQIDLVTYQQRKERYTARIHQMLNFVKEEAACRSRIIGTYFGDKEIRSCGICDNCLRLKAVSISKEEFDALHHRIINLVKYESLHSKELLQKLTDTKKEKVWKVIEFLQAENKIRVDSSGKILLK